jgi:hypothetical protein
MKYIDAGTTAEKISNEFEIPMSELCDVFADIPAADVQPAKRGKWEHEHYNEQIECYVANCSECGYESTDKYRITSNHRYCEYCSARMDGDT